MKHIKLTGVTREDMGLFDRLKLAYEGTHDQNGKTLHFNMLLTEHHPKDGGFVITIDFGGCEAPTIQEALTKIGEWCTRAGETLANRGESDLQIPT